MSPTQNDQKSHHYSPLPQSELDNQPETRPNHENDQGQPSSTSSTSTQSDSSSDNQTGNFENGDHDVRLTLLPEADQSHSNENQQQIPLSISMEYPGPTTDYYYFNEMQNNEVNAEVNKEESQDILGLTVLIMLILSPFYRLMESPTGNPVPPLFTLNSMYVSNFTTFNETLSATWDAKLAVENANVSSIYFRYMEMAIFYNDNPEDVVSGVLVKPFYLEEGEAVKLHVKFATSGGAWEGSGRRVERRVAEEIGREREREGAVKFGMEMKVEAVYNVGTWVGDVEMSPYCEGLRVQFLENQGSGRLTLTDRNFSVPIAWKPFSMF